jgi:hypothetical protein
MAAPRRRQPTTWTASGGMSVTAAYAWVCVYLLTIIDAALWLVTR